MGSGARQAKGPQWITLPDAKRCFSPALALFLHISRRGDHIASPAQ
jgi:hypothetical protein